MRNREQLHKHAQMVQVGLMTDAEFRQLHGGRVESMPNGYLNVFLFGPKWTVLVPKVGA